MSLRVQAKSCDTRQNVCNIIDFHESIPSVKLPQQFANHCSRGALSLDAKSAQRGVRRRVRKEISEKYRYIHSLRLPRGERGVEETG